MFGVRFRYSDPGFVASLGRVLFRLYGRHLVFFVREQCFFAVTPHLLIVVLSPPTKRSLVRSVDSPFLLVFFIQTGGIRQKAVNSTLLHFLTEARHGKQATQNRS